MKSSKIVLWVVLSRAGRWAEGISMCTSGSVWNVLMESSAEGAGELNNRVSGGTVCAAVINPDGNISAAEL